MLFEKLVKQHGVHRVVADCVDLAALVAYHEVRIHLFNFFCHKPPVPNNAREVRWRERLKPYYEEFGIDPAAPVPSSNRAPFDDAFCAVIEELKPEIVSFHFGLPPAPLYARVRRIGCLVISSATSDGFYSGGEAEAIANSYWDDP